MRHIRKTEVEDLKREVDILPEQLIDGIMSKTCLPRKYADLIFAVLKRIPRDQLEVIFTVFERFVLYEACSVAGATKITLICPSTHFTEEMHSDLVHEAYIIDLIEENLNLFSEAAKRAIIAHELAHVYCNHDRFVSSKEPLKDEDEADEVVKRWGFKRELQALLNEQKKFNPR